MRQSSRIEDTHSRSFSCKRVHQQDGNERLDFLFHLGLKPMEESVIQWNLPLSFSQLAIDLQESRKPLRAEDVQSLSKLVITHDLQSASP